jgi:hypothetical protein
MKEKTIAIYLDIHSVPYADIVLPATADIKMNVDVKINADVKMNMNAEMNAYVSRMWMWYLTFNILWEAIWVIIFVELGWKYATANW